MKKTLRMLLLVLVLCVGLVMPAAAETTDGFASDHICMVDMAGVLNEQEVTELEMMIDEIRTRQKFDIAILIVSEEDIPSVEEYADDIYDRADMGYGQTRDGVLLVVDLKSSECYMSTKGMALRFSRMPAFNMLVSRCGRSWRPVIMRGLSHICHTV